MNMKVSDLVTDTPTRLRVEAHARADAEAGRREAPAVGTTGTYQQQLVQGAVAHIYEATYAKRAARIARIKAAA